MNDHLTFLRDLKSVAIATIDNDRPAVRIADLMLVEDEKLYFLVPRGKAFYRQLKESPFVAILGMDSSYKTVRVTGPVEFVDRKWLERIYEANPVMNEIYTGEQLDILEVYCMPRGVGEVFDLSVIPPVSERFAFGGSEPVPRGFKITDACIECGICKTACPEKCINASSPYVIGKNCIECGRCFEKCPVNAIIRPQLFRYDEIKG